jgi:hypothetical protein
MPVKFHRRFGRMYCFHLQVRRQASKWSESSPICLRPLFSWILAGLGLCSWRWRECVPPKRRWAKERDITCQKMVLFIVTVLRKSDPKFLLSEYAEHLKGFQWTLWGCQQADKWGEYLDLNEASNSETKNIMHEERLLCPRMWQCAVCLICTYLLSTWELKFSRIMRSFVTCMLHHTLLE